LSAENLSLVPVWSQFIQAEPCGLSLAREKGWLLAWDRSQWIYLLNQAGQVQAQVRFPGTIAQCALADDGSGAVVAGREGELRWLAPDLTIRWERTLENPLTAAAVDPFGHFLAISDSRGILHLFDAGGKTLAKSQAPRPLQHIAFISGLPLIACCADYGLVGAVDKEGTWRWREALVLNLGDLSVNAEGTSILLACFSEGLHHFNSDGKAQPRIATPEPCRLIAQSFDGDRLLVAGMTNHMFCLDRSGQILCRHSLDKPLAAVAFGPRGDSAYVALLGGDVVKLRLKKR
jgi:hypothetical protein